MLEHYTGIYRDKHGDESIVIQNDGGEPSMTLRGVEFTGQDITDMAITDPTDRPEIASFTLRPYKLHRNGNVITDEASLCAYTIEYEMPLPVVAPQETVIGTLTVFASVAAPNESRLNTSRLSLTLNGKTYRENGVGGHFESELNQIQGIPGNFSALKDKENFLPE